MLHKKTFEKLFKYQYSHWVSALKPLSESTFNDSTDIPEWCDIYLHKNYKSEWINLTNQKVEKWNYELNSSVEHINQNDG